MATETAVLAGPPAAVSGFLPFHNTGADALTITEVVVGDPDTDAALAVSVERTEVPADGRVRIPVELSLPPQTPPDSYPLIMRVADARLEATAHVAPSPLLALSPAVLVVENRPGEKLRRTVVVANEGNVAIHVPQVRSLPLYREDTALATLRMIADPTSLPPGARLDPLPDPVAELGISTEGRSQVIEPGEARPVRLVVVVPDELAQTHRFLAALPISVGTLLLTIVPSATPSDPSPNDRSTPAPTGSGDEQR